MNQAHFIFRLGRSNFILLILTVLLSQALIAQESQTPQLRAAVLMGYSHIPRAFDGDKTITVIPVWGLDIDYVVNPKWALALQTDIKMQSFEVEDFDNVVLVRNYPVSLTLAGLYKPFTHWSFFLGPRDRI